MLDHMLEHEWIHLLTLWSSLNATIYVFMHVLRLECRAERENSLSR